MIRPICTLLSAVLLLAALSACSVAIHGVSTAESTNVQGAPGTAGDAATGGQSNRLRFR